MASASLKSRPTKRLEGKVVIITGGASGIGAAAASLFHANGASVLVADIEDDLGRGVAAELGEGAEYVHCDITNEGEVSSLVDSAVAKHGKLDIMYSNAGVIDKIGGPIVDTTISDLDLVMRVNVYGSFLAAKHAARVMMQQRRGCILFTGSAFNATTGMGTSSYTASKFGVLGLTKKLAAELGEYGVRVNCVSPIGVAGTRIANRFFSAEQTEHLLSNVNGPILTPLEVAHTALYLASDEAASVNGVDLVMRGGVRGMVNPTITTTSEHFVSE